MICIRNLFESISFINRTNSRQIWTPTCEDIDHNAKSPSFGPPKKNPQILTSFLISYVIAEFDFMRIRLYL